MRPFVRTSTRVACANVTPCAPCAPAALCGLSTCRHACPCCACQPALPMRMSPRVSLFRAHATLHGLCVCHPMCPLVRMQPCVACAYVRARARLSVCHPVRRLRLSSPAPLVCMSPCVACTHVTPCAPSAHATLCGLRASRHVCHCCACPSARPSAQVAPRVVVRVLVFVVVVRLSPCVLCAYVTPLCPLCVCHPVWLVLISPHVPPLPHVRVPPCAARV